MMELFLYLLFRGPYGFLLSTLLAVAQPARGPLAAGFSNVGARAARGAGGPDGVVTQLCRAAIRDEPPAREMLGKAILMAPHALVDRACTGGPDISDDAIARRV